MVDIELCSLGALKEDVLSRLSCLVKLHGYIAEKGREFFGKLHVLAIDFIK